MEADQLVITIDEPNIKPQPQITAGSTKTLGRLNFSKPRSRFEEGTNRQKYDSSYENIISSELSSDEDEEEEETAEGMIRKVKKKRSRSRKINKRAVMEWVLFVVIMTCLVCSLTLQSLKYDKKYWGVEVWKWCLMVMVVLCGRLVSGWLVGAMVCLSILLCPHLNFYYLSFAAAS